MSKRSVLQVILALFGTWSCALAQQNPAQGCEAIPEHGKLQSTLQSVIKQGQQANTGLGNQEWAVVVNRDGIVCAVTFSGPDRSVQWPGSRLVAAEKASTANALSGPNFALSTANLWAGAQPGGALFGLTTAGTPNPAAAFAGDPKDFGQPNDPLVGKPIGGMIVFGGGLPLYASKGKIVGGLGVSGDTSCTDHIVAWKMRHALALDAVPMGPAPGGTDNMIVDVDRGRSPSGFGHPSC